jgi:single-strand DNA-binding protein
MILAGVVRIGNDPSIRITPSGDQVMELSLAFNYGKKDESGKKPTQWISAALWGVRAEKLAPYLKKGGQVSVVLAEPHISTYDKKDGTQGVSLRAKISEIELLAGSKDEPKQKAALDDDIPF